MNSFSALISLVLFCAVGAFKSARPFGVRFTSISATNKVDGIQINGDLTPLSNNLLIKVREAASATSGGLFIPDNAKERPTEGKCIAAGPGRVHPETGVQLDCPIKVGDGVIYGKYDGTELRYNDINHQLIKDDDVLLKYSGENPTLDTVECIKDQVLIKLPPKEESNSAGIIISTPDLRTSALTTVL